MASFKQSAAWLCFVPNKTTPQEFVRLLAEIGYAGADLADKEYWPLVREHGLAITAYDGHQPKENGLNRLENHDRIERELRANIALAERWGIPTLICFSGNRGRLGDEVGAEVTAAGLRRVARAAEEAGDTLALELLNSKVDHPDDQCDRTA